MPQATSSKLGAANVPQTYWEQLQAAAKAGGNDARAISKATAKRMAAALGSLGEQTKALLESSKAAQDSAAPAGSAQALELGTLLSRVLAIAQMQDKQASSGPSASEEECSLNLVTSSSVTTVSSTMQQLTMALSSRSYFEALGLYMQVEIPSMQWATAPAAASDIPATTEAGSAVLQATLPAGKTARVPTPSDIELLRVRQRLLQWTTQRLAQAHPDASLILLHHALLEEAVRSQPTLMRSQQLQWWQLHLPPDTSETPRMVSALYHMSPSHEIAWLTLMRIFWHGMAVPCGPAEAFIHDPPSHWVPSTFARRAADLEDRTQRLVARLCSPEMIPEGPRRRRTEVACKEALKMMLPRTYLQMVGQKLLFHAANQLPALLALPSAIPSYVIFSLYTRPFAEALRLAFETVIENPGIDPMPFVPEARGNDKNQMRSYRALLLADREGGSGNHRGSTAGGAAATAAGGGAGAGGGGGGGGGGQGIDAHTSRSFLAITQAIFRDVHCFERGLLRIMDSQDSKAAQAHKALLREEIQATVARLRPAIGALIIEGMTAAVAGLLSAERSATSYMQVEVLQDSWPAAEFVRVDFADPEVVMRTISRRQADVSSLIDRDRPIFIDDVSYQVLSMVTGHLFRMIQYPEALQVYMARGVLECLCLLMDRLATVCVPAHDLPVLSPQLLLLYHSAACCVRRRLESFRKPLDLTLQDEEYEAMIKQYSSTLLQANELIASIQRHTVTAYVDITNTIIFWHVDKLDWGTFRRPLKRADAPSAAPRVWRCALYRLLHCASRISSLQFTEWLLSQVVQETLAIIALRYLLLSPSPQRLPQYVADIAHVASTVYMLCLQYTLPGVAKMQNTEQDEEDTSGPAAGGGQREEGGAAAPPPRSVPSTLAALTTAAAAAGAPGAPPLASQALPTKQLQVPAPVMRRLAAVCRMLFARAGLLLLPAPDLAAALSAATGIKTMCSAEELAGAAARADAAAALAQLPATHPHLTSNMVNSMQNTRQMTSAQAQQQATIGSHQSAPVAARQGHAGAGTSGTTAQGTPSIPTASSAPAVDPRGSLTAPASPLSHRHHLAPLSRQASGARGEGDYHALGVVTRKLPPLKTTRDPNSASGGGTPVSGLGGVLSEGGYPTAGAAGDSPSLARRLAVLKSPDLMSSLGRGSSSPGFGSSRLGGTLQYTGAAGIPEGHQSGTPGSGRLGGPLRPLLSSGVAEGAGSGGSGRLGGPLRPLQSTPPGLASSSGDPGTTAQGQQQGGGAVAEGLEGVWGRPAQQEAQQGLAGRCQRQRQQGNHLDCQAAQIEVMDLQGGSDSSPVLPDILHDLGPLAEYDGHYSETQGQHGNCNTPQASFNTTGRQEQQPVADAVLQPPLLVAGTGGRGRQMQAEWLEVPSRVSKTVPVGEAQESEAPPLASTLASQTQQHQQQQQQQQQQQSGRHLVRVQSSATPSQPQGGALSNTQQASDMSGGAGEATGAAPAPLAPSRPSATSRAAGSGLAVGGGSVPLRSALARGSAGFQDDALQSHGSRGGVEGGALSRAGSMTSVKSVRFGGRASTAGGSEDTSDGDDLGSDAEEGHPQGDGHTDGRTGGHTSREGGEGVTHRRRSSQAQVASRDGSPSGGSATRSRRGSRRSTGHYGSGDGGTGQHQRLSHAGSDHRSSAHSTFLTSQGAVGRAGSGVGSAAGDQVDPEDVWDWLPSQLHLQLSSGVLSLQHPFDAMEHMDVSGENPMEGSTGAAWRDTMLRLARSASAQDLQDALRKRHELHPEVEGLPLSEDEREGRRLIRSLAYQLLVLGNGSHAEDMSHSS